MLGDEHQKGYGTGAGPAGVGPPVTGQPAGFSGALPPAGQGQGWMPAVAPSAACPPGMEYLTQLDQLLIQQETQMMEIITGWECKNKFRVVNSLGQQVYYALEESSICQRMCCGQNRGFVYHITDNLQQEVFRVRRDFQCFTGCWVCPTEACYYFATVEDKNGHVLGHVSNLSFCCTPRFGIWDEGKSLVAEIRGPWCPFQMVCCTDDIQFPIVDTGNGSELGMISKQWPGLIKEMFTDSDNFRVSFPINLDVKKKALMFGAIFVIDMMLYERKQRNN